MLKKDKYKTNKPKDWVQKMHEWVPILYMLGTIIGVMVVALI